MKRGYATKITGERTQVPTVGFRPAASQGRVAPLQMGWALKTAKKKTMFSQEQNKYLTEQFVIGEESGKKADPKQVLQDMRKVRSESGVRLFLGKDVLSSQQVSGLFSRLAAKIQKASPTEPDEQENAIEAESLHSQLHEVVHDEVALRHPIVSLSRNICNLVNTNKLSSLSVGMLKEICESLGLNVDDIKQRRKKPSIERISQVVGDCYVHSDVSGVPRFACSNVNNVTQIPRHCRTNDGHVLVVAMVIRAIFYEIPTDQLIEVLKNLIARVVKSNVIC